MQWLNSPFFAAAQKNVKTAVKTGPGYLYGWSIHNLDASITYVQIYDATLANVTVGTTAASWTLAVPASGDLNAFLALPINFANAISLAATTTATGSTAQSNGLIFNAFYL